MQCSLILWGFLQKRLKLVIRDVRGHSVATALFEINIQSTMTGRDQSRCQVWGYFLGCVDNSIWVSCLRLGRAARRDKDAAPTQDLRTFNLFHWCSFLLWLLVLCLTAPSLRWVSNNGDVPLTLSSRPCSTLSVIAHHPTLEEKKHPPLFQLFGPNILYIVVNKLIRSNPGISGRLERKRKRERSNLAQTVMAHNACQLAEICPSDAVKTNK